MYLADMAEIAKAGFGLPPGLLRKLTDEEIAKFKAAPDKMAYRASRLKELMSLHAKLSEDIRKVEQRAAMMTAIERKREILRRLAYMRRDLHQMEKLMEKIRSHPRFGVNGLGSGWEATGVALMENPGTAFLLPISIAIAIGLGIAVISGRQEVARLFPAFGEAAKIAMTVVGIAGAFLGIIWVVRIGSDLAAGDKKKKADEPEARRRLSPIAPSHAP